MLHLRPAYLSSNGILILAVTGGYWMAVGVTGLGIHAAYPAMVAAALGVSLFVAAVRFRRTVRATVSTLPDDERRPTRQRPTQFWWVFGAEAVLISLSAITCVRLGRPDLIVPAMGLIVGLHFLPLAKIFDIAIYYFTGIAASAVSTVAVLGLFGYRQATVGIGIGVILWTSALYMLLTTNIETLRRQQ